MSKWIEKTPSRELYGSVRGSGYHYGSQEPEFWLYARLLRKRVWLICAVALTVVSAVAIQTFSTTPLYRSSAKVRIDPEASNVLPYKEVSGALESFLASETYLQTQYRILQSRSLARRVVQALSLSENAAFNQTPNPGLFPQVLSAGRAMIAGAFSTDAIPRESDDEESELVNRLLGDLAVDPIRQSRLVEVSYVSHDPGLASEIVNALINEFIEQNFESRYDASRRATDFLQKQLLDLKIRVEKSEEEAIAYAREHGILNLGDRDTIVIQRLADLNEQVTKVQADLVGKSARFQIVESASAERFPETLKTEVIIGLEKQLLLLEKELVSLTTKFGDDWPEVVTTRREVDEVTSQLRRERERAIEQAKMDFQAANSHLQMLLSLVEEQKEVANKLSEDSIQYNILSREVETNKQLYEGLLQRLKEAGVAAGLRSSNIQLVDPGEVPWRVYRPRKALNLALGLAVGLLVGICLAFLIEYTDRTLRTPDQVEQLLGLPSLGVIPTMEQSEVKQEVLITGQSESEGLTRLPHLDHRTRSWEAYRLLRTSILLSSSSRQPKSLLVTSSFSSEGKSTTTGNIGIVFAQTGARTLLLDLDLRRPSIASRFGLNGGGGMSTFLSGNTDFASLIQKTGIPNLYAVTAGPVPPNPAELMGSERMEGLLRLVSEYFAYIIIDSPPVLSVSDPLIVSPKVDGVVMVVHGGKTSRDAVVKATMQLEHVGAKILGVVVNNVDLRSSDYSYYYRDYYDYADYSEERHV